VILTSYEYVVGIATFFQCVLLIKLSTWEDEWLVVIEPLEEDKNKTKEGGKRGRRKKKF